MSDDGETVRDELDEVGYPLFYSYPSKLHRISRDR